ncbi:uncharacterized protein LOC130963096 [Arachis stenosperma]|uniref:uncharacterized protein LOC130963096 n=1 Tax=Arachis stenosperma TaxID=217475 RepID=UPI0025AC81C4|nr:uncharacterized protein LOC130963096 [Arachis stenosperma]
MASTKLPSGASKKFKPIDEELIQDFLRNKISGRPLPNYGTILEGEFLRMVRTIGLDSWEGEDIGKEIMANKTNQRIGTRKQYRFEKSGTSHDGGWILHQYTIDSSLLPNPSNMNNYVLCRFRKNNIKPRQKRRKPVAPETVATVIPNANDYAEIVEFVNQSENGDEKMEIQNESAEFVNQLENGDESMEIQNKSANPSNNNGNKKIDEIQKELTNQLENNKDEIKVEALATTIGIEAKCDEMEDGDDDGDGDDDEDHNDMTWPEFFAMQLIEVNKD